MVVAAASGDHRPVGVELHLLVQRRPDRLRHAALDLAAALLGVHHRRRRRRPARTAGSAPRRSRGRPRPGTPCTLNATDRGVPSWLPVRRSAATGSAAKSTRPFAALHPVRVQSAHECRRRPGQLRGGGQQSRRAAPSGGQHGAPGDHDAGRAERAGVVPGCVGVGLPDRRSGRRWCPARSRRAGRARWWCRCRTRWCRRASGVVPRRSSTETDASAKCPRGGMVAIIATAMPSPTRHCGPSGGGRPVPRGQRGLRQVEALVQAVAAEGQIVVAARGSPRTGRRARRRCGAGARTGRCRAVGRARRAPTRRRR